VITIPAPVEMHLLDLSSSLRPFLLRFTGQITCDGAPCRGEVEVVIDTDQSPNTHKLVPVAADGTYSVELPIRERPNSQLDWRVLARDGQRMPAEAHGRQILVDGPDVSFDKPLNLRG
jgi:hypothetical protein